ncbi:MULTISPECIES: phage tail protein [Flavobacterium]|uniref:phage tail protein n=1 Tax=Flavobacterium TaxID=237 RepID=UPI001182B00B|nr:MULTISPECIES: tail fiber protein [Flavobacterium]MCR4033843.1 tail fiber protein [Flavobacterium panacis]
MDGYIGEIRHFAAGFAPRNWAYCNGQIVAIQSNTPLFAIIGTTYGGNGSTTFQLPNFAGRVAIGAGTAVGLSTYANGQQGGTNTHQITINELAAHNHPVTSAFSIPAYSDTGNLNTPSGNTLASKNKMYSTTEGDDPMKPVTYNIVLANAGTGQSPISLMQPTIGINYIICLYGLFPPRS